MPWYRIEDIDQVEGLDWHPISVDDREVDDIVEELLALRCKHSEYSSLRYSSDVSYHCSACEPMVTWYLEGLKDE